MTMDRNSTDDALALARVYRDARNYRRAEEVLRSALVHNPQDGTLLTELAFSQHLGGDNAAAEQSVRSALDVAPEYAYPMRVYASILDEMGHRREAVQWARRAVNAAPLDGSTQYEYARILLNAGDAEGALPAATEALRLRPADADSHNLMGMVLSGLGRSAESTAKYEEALRLAPEHAMALHNIAVNQLHSRRLSSALSGFREAARLDPGIGDLARQNITTTVHNWLSWTTILASVALNISVRMEHEGEATPPGPRIVAGCAAVVLLGLFVWLARSLPWTTWRSLLVNRDRKFLALKLYIGLSVFVVAVLGAFALGAPIGFWYMLGALAITVVVSWVAPWIESRTGK
jgi:tetratricopeptide (TPR) repeat protein